MAKSKKQISQEMLENMTSEQKTLLILENLEAILEKMEQDTELGE